MEYWWIPKDVRSLLNLGEKSIKIYRNIQIIMKHWNIIANSFCKNAHFEKKIHDSFPRSSYIMIRKSRHSTSTLINLLSPSQNYCTRANAATFQWWFALGLNCLPFSWLGPRVWWCSYKSGWWSVASTRHAYQGPNPLFQSILWCTLRRNIQLVTSSSSSSSYQIDVNHTSENSYSLSCQSDARLASPPTAWTLRCPNCDWLCQGISWPCANSGGLCCWCNARRPSNDSWCFSRWECHWWLPSR